MSRPETLSLIATLRDRHEDLRDQIDRCLALADDFDCDRVSGRAVAVAVVRIRRLLEQHNALEEEVLPRLLAHFEGTTVDSASCRQLIERRGYELDTQAPTTPALRATLAELREQMAVEDRDLARIRAAHVLR